MSEQDYPDCKLFERVPVECGVRVRLKKRLEPEEDERSLMEAITPDPRKLRMQELIWDQKSTMLFSGNRDSSSVGYISVLANGTPVLQKSCQYSLDELPASMKICWLDDQTSVYSFDSTIRVQRIGLGILNEMELEPHLSQLHCGKWMFNVQLDNRKIHAWNVSFPAPRALLGRGNQTVDLEQLFTEPDPKPAISLSYEPTSDDSRGIPFLWAIGGVVTGVLFTCLFTSIVICMIKRRKKRMAIASKQGNNTQMDGEEDSK